MTETSPFHKGELAMQALAGEQAIASQLGGMIQETIPSRAFDFIRQQYVIWIGIEEQAGLLWAFPILGSPGFINPNSGEQLDIDFKNNFSIPDEWRSYLKKGKSIACLVINLATRGRLRINGVISTIDKKKLQISVQQAYPNCPKYIRKREVTGKFDASEFHLISSGEVLKDDIINIISQSDTAFVTSIGPNGADVSHRGGASGFVKCLNGKKVRVPDYKGNSMFNTLGNFKTNPVAGLLIVDFEKSFFLQLSGQVDIIFNKEQVDVDTAETNRSWELEIRKWFLFQLESNFEWKGLDFSPHNP